MSTEPRNWRPRDVASYVHAFMAKLPRGEIWPRDPDSTLVRVVTGLMGIVARWADDVGTLLLREAFPPLASPELLLPDWERVLGLPEPCFPAALTLEERRLQVLEKLQRRPGAQSRPYFLEIAERLGYTGATITEYRPFMAGVSRAGDPAWNIAPPKMRYLWTIGVPAARLTWFRAGSGMAGTDPHLTIAQAEDLECILGKLKPAHTKLIFDYSGGVSE